jgi:hypothetical protein
MVQYPCWNLRPDPVGAFSLVAQALLPVLFSASNPKTQL